MTETTPQSGRPTGRPTGRPGGANKDAVGEGAIRRIFPLFVVFMWVVAGFMVANDTWSGLNTLILVTAAVICAVVFKNFVYVFNYGYATSITVLTVLVLAVRGISPVALALGILLIAYGVRLWAFVWARYRSPGYAAQREGLKHAHRALPGFVKGFIYVNTTTLMTFHAMTMVTVASAEKEFDAVASIGLVLVACGLAIEAIADRQKQQAKAVAPKAFVSTGLFARTRHPNYLGEIMFQTGIAIVGVSAAQEWFGYAAVILGPLYIVVLMLSMVMRGEATKRASYADDPAFPAYLARTGALLPSLRTR